MREFKRNAKIIATLGPSSGSAEIIANMIRAGLDVVRLNMGYGTHVENAQLISNVRKASIAVGKQIAVILDLQGPNTRVDQLNSKIELHDGEVWYLGFSDNLKDHPELKNRSIPTTYKNIALDCNVGDKLFFDEGLMHAVVIEKDKELLQIKVTLGGELTQNCRINLPDTNLSLARFTSKDYEDLIFGLAHDIDYIAIPMVKSADDVRYVKNILKEKNKEIPIISKLDNGSALNNLDEIIHESDIVMIARGDMAVEIGDSFVPEFQKRIVSRCNHFGVPVITTTQVLGSMTKSLTPTRAEASDVANAIWDGVDAIMLTEVTAHGEFPVESIMMIDKIIEEAETTPKEQPLLRNMELDSIGIATMVGAATIAEKVKAKRIVVVTNTGNSCKMMSRFRSKTLVLGVTDSVNALRKMSLYWGIRPFFVVDYDKDNNHIEFDVLEAVKGFCKLEKGDRLVIVRGDEEFFKAGSANTIRTDIIK